MLVVRQHLLQPIYRNDKEIPVPWHKLGGNWIGSAVAYPEEPGVTDGLRLKNSIQSFHAVSRIHSQ
jgi:hypothetical protein